MFGVKENAIVLPFDCNKPRQQIRKGARVIGKISLGGGEGRGSWDTTPYTCLLISQVVTKLGTPLFKTHVEVSQQ